MAKRSVIYLTLNLPSTVRITGIISINPHTTTLGYKSFNYSHFTL